MYVNFIIFIFSVLLVVHLPSCSARKSQFMTIALNKSHSVHSLNHFKTRAAMIQQRMGTCTNVSLVDFQDMYYFGWIDVGYIPYPIRVVFDTGSADLWVPSSYLCVKPSSYCHHHHWYDHSGSETYKEIGTPFKITYRKGYVSGVVSQDIVNVGGLPITGQLFGEATDMDPDTTLAEYDGIFGLAYPSVAMIDGRTPFINLFHQGLLNQPVFAFSLTKKYDYVLGELTLGGLDPTKYSGDVTYTPVIEQGYWKIQIGGISVGSQTVAPSSAAVPDSGSSLIGGPKHYIDIINDAIGATEYGSGINIVDCSTLPNLPSISIMIEGKAFVLTSYDYTLKVSDDEGNDVCISGFMGSSDLQFFILGDVFMRKFYSVFDMGLNRVGFADYTDPLPTHVPEPASGGELIASCSLFVLLVGLLQICSYNRRQ